MVSNDAAGILHAVSPGTATITVRLSGLSNSAPITVTGGGTGSAGRLTIERTGANYTLTLEGGTSGTTVRFQRTPNLVPTVTWTDISTNTIPPAGVVSIQDTNAPGQAFYRVISP